MLIAKSSIFHYAKITKKIREKEIIKNQPVCMNRIEYQPQIIVLLFFLYHYSPTGSFRSSSRFFSFLGTTITGRWERPPPTYDEALKHVNPDLARPSAPPPYNDFVASTVSEVAAAAGNGDRRGSAASHGIVETPPPEYQSQENSLHRLHMLEVGDGT